MGNPIETIIHPISRAAAYASLLLAFISCAPSNPAKPADKAKARTSCPDDLFRAETGMGESISEASDDAQTKIAKGIISDVNYRSGTEKRKEKNSEDKITTSSKFSASSQIESNFTLYGFKEMEPPKQLEDGNYEFRGYVCNSNVAKPYLKSLQNYRDSLKTFKRQKIDKDNCGRAIEIRNNMRDFEIIVEVLEQVDKSLQREYENIYAEIENDCGLEASKKIHWNPEKQTAYSDIAFSKLSAGIEMETSPCKGKGISLVYRGSEPKCSYRFGFNTCSYEPSLSVRACNGAEYLRLSGSVKNGIHERPDIALENVQSNLNSAEFWDKWIEEINQWRH